MRGLLLKAPATTREIAAILEWDETRAARSAVSHLCLMGHVEWTGIRVEDRELPGYSLKLYRLTEEGSRYAEMHDDPVSRS